jgi:hypothetical protein
MKTFIRSCATAGLLLSTLGAQCPQSSPMKSTGQGFVQTVSIEPAEPHTGDRITIRTQVRNAGPEPQSGTFMACALGFGGDLELSDVPGTVRCLAVSFEKQLAPGETIEGADTKVVDSPAGTYVLEVRYLINPPMSQNITVRVLPN